VKSSFDEENEWDEKYDAGADGGPGRANQFHTRDMKGFGDGWPPRKNLGSLSRSVTKQHGQNQIQGIGAKENHDGRFARTQGPLHARELKEQEDREASAHDHPQILDAHRGHRAFGSHDIHDHRFGP